MPRFPIAASLLVGLAACSAAVQTTPLRDAYPPRAPDADVLLFSTRPPECAYEEISLITAFADPALFVSTPDALEAMKRRARELGGDGIAGLTEFPRQASDHDGGVKGTVIRFTDSSCRH